MLRTWQAVHGFHIVAKMGVLPFKRASYTACQAADAHVRQRCHRDLATGGAQLRRFIQTHPLLCFLATSFGLAIPLFAPFGSAFFPALQPLLLILGSAAPAVSALLVAAPQTIGRLFARELRNGEFLSPGILPAAVFRLARGLFRRSRSRPSAPRLPVAA